MLNIPPTDQHHSLQLAHIQYYFSLSLSLSRAHSHTVLIVNLNQFLAARRRVRYVELDEGKERRGTLATRTDRTRRRTERGWRRWREIQAYLHTDPNVIAKEGVTQRACVLEHAVLFLLMRTVNKNYTVDGGMQNGANEGEPDPC